MTEADLALTVFRYLLPVAAMALALWTYASARRAILDAHQMPDQYAQDCQTLRAMVKGLEDRFDAHVKRMAQQKSIEARQAPTVPAGAVPGAVPSASPQPTGANGAAVPDHVLDQIINTNDPHVQAELLRRVKA